MLVKEILNESVAGEFSDDLISLYNDIVYSCGYIRRHKLLLNFKNVEDSLDENDIRDNINEIHELMAEYEQLSTAEVRASRNLSGKKAAMDMRINIAYRSMNRAEPLPPINYSSIREDIVDFKGPNGQLSAMGTKRPKTKKDAARSEVEQLFKENKK